MNPSTMRRYLRRRNAVVRFIDECETTSVESGVAPLEQSVPSESLYTTIDHSIAAVTNSQPVDAKALLQLHRIVADVTARALGSVIRDGQISEYIRALQNHALFFGGPRSAKLISQQLPQDPPVPAPRATRSPRTTRMRMYRERPSNTTAPIPLVQQPALPTYCAETLSEESGLSEACAYAASESDTSSEIYPSLDNNDVGSTDLGYLQDDSDQPGNTRGTTPSYRF